MMMSVLWTAVVALCLCHRSSGEIPASIPKCHAGDVKCIAKVTNDLLRNNPAGIAELGLVNLEPVHLDEIVVARTDGAKPLSVDLKFVDVDIYGVSKAVFTQVEGFGKDPLTSKFELYVTMPELILRGKYEAKGKILLLPIVGSGRAEVKLTNLKSAVKVKLDVTDKNGKQFLAIKQIKVHNEPELVKVQMDNLFNGSKELGDEFNKVINENWKDVWNEMEEGINDAYAYIVKKIMDGVFRKITYDEFYLSE